MSRFQAGFRGLVYCGIDRALLRDVWAREQVGAQPIPPPITPVGPGMKLGLLGGRSAILATEKSLQQQSLLLQAGFSQIIHPGMSRVLTVGAPIADSYQFLFPFLANHDVSNIHKLAPLRFSK